MGQNEPADLLARLQHLYRYTGTEMARRSRQLGPDFGLHPHFLANIRRKGAIPNVRHLYAISELFQLTLGSTFSLFGFDLDAIVQVELQMNEERTRLIEHYPFGPGKTWLPSELGEAFGAQQTAYLSQMIPRWQEVPYERVAGKAWRTPQCFYGKLGIDDSISSPAIPPGAYVQILRIRDTGLAALSAIAFYFVQHPEGYTVCRCSIEQSRLVLHPYDPSFMGTRRWKLGSEARILGVVTAFASHLPTRPYRRWKPSGRRSIEDRALLPWEHRSITQLFQTSCQRFGLSRKAIDEFNARLLRLQGIRISGKYAKSMHPGEAFPRTASVLAMAVTASLRLRDVFRACGFSIHDEGKFQLQDLLGSDLPPSVQAPAPAPRPQSLWATFLSHWQEWPLLLRYVAPHPETLGHEVIRLHQGEVFQGLDRLLRPGSILRVDTHPVSLASINRDSGVTDWARRLYVIEYGRETPTLACGYLIADGVNLILTPHPASRTTHSLSFRRTEVHIVGVVSGIVARVSEAREDQGSR